MIKPKIVGIKSTSYPNGSIDEFNIEIENNVQGPIMALFEDLGFSKDVVNDLDMDYAAYPGYYFFYSVNLKAHIFVGEGYINLIFDSMMNKEKLVKIIEKYFQIF